MIEIIVIGLILFGIAFGIAMLAGFLGLRDFRP
jgi:hypothetical protein